MISNIGRMKVTFSLKSQLRVNNFATTVCIPEPHLKLQILCCFFIESPHPLSLRDKLKRWSKLNKEGPISQSLHRGKGSSKSTP